jgi:sialic acid synthase SpsE
VPTQAELINMPNMRRSISARRNIAAGSILRNQDLICRRPASGISPSDWDKVLGSKVKRDVAEGELFSWDDLDV